MDTQNLMAAIEQAFGLWSAYLLIGISAFYFIYASRAENIWWRMSCSLHGVLIVFSYVYAALVSSHTHFHYEGWLLTVFYFIFVLAIASSVTAVVKLKINKYVHIMLAPIFVYGYVFSFAGALRITHDAI